MKIDPTQGSSAPTRAARQERLQEAAAQHTQAMAGLDPSQVAAHRSYYAQALDDIQQLRTGLSFPPLS